MILLYIDVFVFTLPVFDVWQKAAVAAPSFRHIDFFCYDDLVGGVVGVVELFCHIKHIFTPLVVAAAYKEVQVDGVDGIGKLAKGVEDSSDFVAGLIDLTVEGDGHSLGRIMVVPKIATAYLSGDLGLDYIGVFDVGDVGGTEGVGL